MDIQDSRVVDPNAFQQDGQVDKAMRPKLLQDYVGQTKICQQLSIFIDAAKGRDEALDHILIFGPHRAAYLFFHKFWALFR